MKTLLGWLQKIVLTVMVMLAGSIVVVAMQGPDPLAGSTEVLAVEPFQLTVEPPSASPSNHVEAAFKSVVEAVVPEMPTPMRPMPTPLPSGPRPVRIGIIAGHYKNDSGATCPDGLREVDINLAVAERVIARLKRKGYEVDLFGEFDERLTQYTADALLSLHSDSCEIWGLTGFKVARSTASGIPEIEDRLVGCVTEAYSASTGLAFTENTITDDMTAYHAFHKVNLQTPAAILELGFMADDRDILVYRQDRIAKGIVDGLQCFLDGKGTN